MWKHDRPKEPNYTSPIILNVAGARPAILHRLQPVFELRPAHGKDAVGSQRRNHRVRHLDRHRRRARLFQRRLPEESPGGRAWPMDRARSPGKPKIACTFPRCWRVDGHLFGVLDAGVAACWKSDTGKEHWKKRLGGEFSASPVLVGDTIYATSESGETFVYRADPHKFDADRREQAGRPGHGEHNDLRQPHLYARRRASRRQAAGNAVLPGKAEVSSRRRDRALLALRTNPTRNFKAGASGWWSTKPACFAAILWVIDRLKPSQPAGGGPGIAGRGCSLAAGYNRCQPLPAGIALHPHTRTPRTSHASIPISGGLRSRLFVRLASSGRA